MPATWLSSLDHLDKFFRTLFVISGLLLFFLASTALNASNNVHTAAIQARVSPWHLAEAMMRSLI